MGAPLTAKRSFATVNDNARHYQHGIQIEIVRSTSAPSGEVKRSIRVSTVGTVIDNTKVCGAPSPFSGGIGLFSKPNENDGSLRLLDSYLCAMEIVDQEADGWAVRDFSPQTLNKQTEVTTSTSFDVNLGFFAGTPTGGASWGSSSSTGWNLTDYELRASAGRPDADQAVTNGPIGSWEIYKDPQVTLPEISFGSLQPKLEIIFETTRKPTSRYTRIATAASTQYTITTHTEGAIGKIIDQVPEWGFTSLIKSGIRSLINFLTPKNTESLVDVVSHVKTDPKFADMVYGQTYEIDWETGNISIVTDSSSKDFEILRWAADDLKRLAVPRAPQAIPAGQLPYDVEQTIRRVPMGYWPGSDLLVGFSLDSTISNSAETPYTELSIPDPDASIESLWRMEAGSEITLETSAAAWPFRGALAVKSPKGSAIWSTEPGARRRDYTILTEKGYREPFLWLPEAPQGIVGDFRDEMSIVWRDHLLTFKGPALSEVRRLECLSRVVAATRVSAGWLAISGGHIYISSDRFHLNRKDMTEQKIGSDKTTLLDEMRKVYDPAQPCGLLADGERVYLLSGRRTLSFNVEKGGIVSDVNATDRLSVDNPSMPIRVALGLPVQDGMPVGFVEAGNDGHILVVRAVP